MKNSIGKFLEEQTPATKTIKQLKVLELSDGSDVNLRVILIKGVDEGPTIYVGGGIHGDEVNGIEGVRNFVNTVNPSQLKGNIIAVPIQNIWAYWVRSRFIPVVGVGQIPDLHLVFPGKRDGDPAEILAHMLLNEVMLHADYIVEFHTGTVGTRNVVHIFTPSAKYGEASRKAEEMAEAFGAKFIFSGVYEDAGMMQNVATSKGIPAIGVELGEGGRIEEGTIEEGVKGIINILKYLKMMEGRPRPPVERIRIKELYHINSPCGGILHLKTREGEYVHKNDTLATVLNPFGEGKKGIKSLVDGYVTKTATLATVNTGDLVVVIGIP